MPQWVQTRIQWGPMWAHAPLFPVWLGLQVWALGLYLVLYKEYKEITGVHESKCPCDAE